MYHPLETLVILQNIMVSNDCDSMELLVVI